MSRRQTPLGAVLRGLVAAGIGTAAMDVQRYTAYRMKGGTADFGEWEFGGIENWEQAGPPGKVGKRLIEAWTQKEPPAEWADLTNNLVHWSLGVQWGAVYGLVGGSMRRPPTPLGGVPFGAGVWLFSYIVLPLGKFYKPIWEYDTKTLADDLFSHLVYGATTALAFRLFSPKSSMLD